MRVVLVVLLVAQVASAQPGKEVTREFQAGVDAFRLGKHDAARKHLERANQLDPKLPGPNRFLAAVAQAQGRFADCVTSARTAIELNPTSQELADTRKLHDDCRRAAGRPSYTQELGDKAAIGVTANVGGATVKISGLVYGATPLEPRPIPAGSHELELTKTGYLPAKLTVTALAGIVTDVEADLAPDPAAERATEAGTKVVPRATGLLILKGLTRAHPTVAEARSDNFLIEVFIDGATGHPRRDYDPQTRGDHDRFDLPPGIHVVEVQSSGVDPWRRRVRITAGQTVEVEVTPVITVSRERIRTKGLWLTGAGAALMAVGAVTVVIGTGRDEAVTRRTFYGLGAGAVGLGALVLGFGATYLYRGRRPDLTSAPPLAIVPTEGGVIASTGLDF